MVLAIKPGAPAWKACTPALHALSPPGNVFFTPLEDYTGMWSSLPTVEKGKGAALLTFPSTLPPDAALCLLLGLWDTWSHLLPLCSGRRPPLWTSLPN